MECEVYLEQFALRHCDKYSQWMQDPELLELTKSDPMDFTQVVQLQKDMEVSESAWMSIVMCRTTNQMIGDVGIYAHEFLAEEDGDCVAEINLMIAEKSWRGKGLGKQIVELATDWAISNTLIGRLVAKIDQENHCSLRLFEKLGWSRRSQSETEWGEVIFEKPLKRDNMMISEKAKEFIQWSRILYPKDASLVEALLTSNDETRLKQMFGKRIAFGTAGLRGLMAPGYANMNDLVILQASQGLCTYALDQIPKFKEKGILIGFDARHNSSRFAYITAHVFLSRGVKVFLCSSICGTPLVPFGILELGCGVGVMVTASHNPKDDNGYKVYWENGAQIIPPHDEGIAFCITKNLEPWKELDLSRVGEKVDAALVEDPLNELKNRYLKMSAENYCFHKETNARNALKIAYTAMHGVGYRFVQETFAAFNLPEPIPVLEQVHPDPDFPTVAFPNPEEGKGALALSMATADRSGCTLILANDPDADRLAVAEKQEEYHSRSTRFSRCSGSWKIFSGNEIAAVLADWAVVNRRKKGCDLSKCFMVASTVSSKFLQSMGAHEGFQFIDTLTGFKWIGNAAIEYQKKGMEFLFAYEVEIGFLFGNLSFDKDGIRTAAIFAEMAEQLRREGKFVASHLAELRKRYGYYEMANSYFFSSTREQIDDVFKYLRSAEDSSYHKSIGGFKVASVRDITLGLDSAIPGGKAILPRMPNDQMITYRFENGAVATLRNSGTEPKLKYYVECFDKTSEEAARKLLHAMTDAIISVCLRPSETGLESPKAS